MIWLGRRLQCRPLLKRKAARPCRRGFFVGTRQAPECDYVLAADITRHTAPEGLTSEQVDEPTHNERSFHFRHHGVCQSQNRLAVRGRLQPLPYLNDNHRPQAFSQSNPRLLRPTAPGWRRTFATFFQDNRLILQHCCSARKYKRATSCYNCVFRVRSSLRTRSLFSVKPRIFHLPKTGAQAGKVDVLRSSPCLLLPSAWPTISFAP